MDSKTLKMLKKSEEDIRAGRTRRWDEFYKETMKKNKRSVTIAPTTG